MTVTQLGNSVPCIRNYWHSLQDENDRRNRSSRCSIWILVQDRANVRRTNSRGLHTLCRKRSQSKRTWETNVQSRDLHECKENTIVPRRLVTNTIPRMLNHTRTLLPCTQLLLKSLLSNMYILSPVILMMCFTPPCPNPDPNPNPNPNRLRRVLALGARLDRRHLHTPSTS